MTPLFLPGALLKQTTTTTFGELLAARSVSKGMYYIRGEKPLTYACMLRAVKRQDYTSLFPHTETARWKQPTDMENMARMFPYWE